MSHYEVLGVRPTATAAELRAAYLAAARRDHPDRHMGADAATRARAERRMRAVNEAWAVLGDADRRRAYDRARAGPTRPVYPSPTSPAGTASASDRARWAEQAPSEEVRDWRAYAAAGGAPARGPRSVGEQIIVLAPAGFLAFAVLCVLAWGLIGWPPFLGIAVVSSVVAASGFFMLPIWVMARSSRPRGGTGGSSDRKGRSARERRRLARARRQPPTPRR